MDESTQQIVALTLVAVVIVLEWLRRRRKKTRGSAGCDSCDNGTAKPSGQREKPLRFYRRR